ncbi:trypsin-like peptidase domain-containing protein [Deinococcus sp. 6YEL10]|uniref:trypsin-like serine peptidase n=1 Tax=Deinococcus sp. 6YEL10 TaxID=2745870 RepID=UPI001E62696C|nr:serine protease [Deinococcus sp. 6YEL10]MCD0162838.1 trypsin-like peptidase domain-containing protein [Deinococcus sp. 6YEL10]
MKKQSRLDKRWPRFVAIIFVFLLGSSVSAIDYILPGNQFGRANLVIPQSLQVPESIIGPTPIFEAIVDFAPSDRYFQIAQSVGRLDIQFDKNGKSWMSTCTATLIANGLLITNYHCTDFDGVIRRMQLRMGYLSETLTGETFEVNIQPTERNADYDYAILEVNGNPGAKYGTVLMNARQPLINETLYIIHHPAGQPKQISRLNCRLHPTRNTDPNSIELLHRCDTLGGSSGSMVMADGDNAIVGLHFAGFNSSVLPSFEQRANYAKRFTKVLAKSSVLTAMSKSAGSADANSDSKIEADAQCRTGGTDFSGRKNCTAEAVVNVGSGLFIDVKKSSWSFLERNGSDSNCRIEFSDYAETRLGAKLPRVARLVVNARSPNGFGSRGWTTCRMTVYQIRP